MALPPASFNQFSRTAFRAVRLVQHSVVWSPYGWVTMLVNCVDQVEFPQSLVIPYMNAKLGLEYPGLGLLANFNYDQMKANKTQGNKYWVETGDSYVEWLGTLTPEEDSQVQQAIPLMPPVQPALMDGLAEDSQVEAPEMERPADEEEDQ